MPMCRIRSLDRIVLNNFCHFFLLHRHYVMMRKKWVKISVLPIHLHEHTHIIGVFCFIFPHFIISSASYSDNILSFFIYFFLPFSTIFIFTSFCTEKIHLHHTLIHGMQLTHYSII